MAPRISNEGQVEGGAVGRLPRDPRLDLRQPQLERLHHRGDRLHQRNDAPGCHRTGPDVAHVPVPDVARFHLADQHLRLGEEGLGQSSAPPVDERNDDEGRQGAAGDHHRGDSDPEDVADADQGRRHGDRGVGLEAQRQLELVTDELEAVGDELEQHPDAQTEEDRRRLSATALGRHQHLGAGEPLRIRQHPVLLLDEVATQGDHGENPDQTPGHREQGDLPQRR
jgi:hypothetical protein